MAKKDLKIAEAVLEAVGGADNVTNVFHCVTRLRFALKDYSKADQDVLRKTDGVLGVKDVGGQLQVIIGTNVKEVYNELCKLANIKAEAAIDENLDSDLTSEKLTWKNIGSKIINYVSSTMIQAVPAMMVGGLFLGLSVILADQFHVISTESDLNKLFLMVYNASFYFLPIYVGFKGVQYFKGNEMMGAFLGAMLIAPTFMALIGQPFTVYGIPAATNDYSSSVFPMLLICPVYAYIEKKVFSLLPESLRYAFGNFLAYAITLPIAMCLLAPLGGYVGTFLGYVFNFLATKGGFVAAILIGALWPFLVMTGMHGPVITIAIIYMTTYGYDPLVIPAAAAGTTATYGVAIGAYLITKKGNPDKNIYLSYIITAFIGGICEPILYGLLLRYKKTILYMMAAGAVSAAFTYLAGVKCYVIAGSTIFAWLGYLVGGTWNFIASLLMIVISCVVAAVLVVMFGLGEESK